MRKPDYNNVLFHKDKQRKPHKIIINAYKFNESGDFPPQEGRQLQDVANQAYPGPGAYMTQPIEKVTT